ncbi:hypothetical protein D9619_004819 [Psilocybe cf. subviscida]|uniref:Cytochrome P450 n=1 Tax=Psilocybe cf. subviscida TaxID=2480587 RepID=A0A8H5BPH3_9AGAR|nr:hypothetical protein D9619_004819 [Psilocybe cf. subviscida]
MIAVNNVRTVRESPNALISSAISALSNLVTLAMAWQMISPASANVAAALVSDDSYPQPEDLHDLLTNDLYIKATHTWLRHWDPVPVRSVLSTLATAPLLTTVLVAASTNGLTHLPSLYTVLQGCIVYHFALIFSVAAYRLSPFHPLAKYPGPTILKLTKLWTVWVAHRGQNHVYMKALHDKYGPTIRIGPNELSTIEKDLIPEILGINGLGKGPLWDGRRNFQKSEEVEKPYKSIIDCRSASIHALLRKPWSKSFTAEPLQDYERLLLRRIVQLNRHLARQIENASDGCTANVNMAKWMPSLAFDFMGDLAFGTSFEIMRDGDVKHEYKTLADGLYLPAVIMHIPWFADIAREFPFISSKNQKLIAMGVTNGIKRSQKELKHKDLFYHIAESAGTTVDDLKIILPDVVTAIIAGSDTTASAMTNAIYLLLTHPVALRALISELDEAFQKHDIPNVSAINQDQEVERFSDVLAGLKYLNGVLNETLRLYPPVATGLQRAPEPGSGGKMLRGGSTANVFLPEGNAICVPPWVLHRDPRNFSPKPEAFIPERWLGDSEVYETNREAFIPFSTGPRSCVGRPLAMMEFRYAIATIFRNFNFEIDTNKCDTDLWDAQILDRFTLSNGTLDVKISFREQATRGAAA